MSVPRPRVAIGLLMRALLLVVLGAALVWFVWRGLEAAAGPVDVQAAPGAMIAVEAPSSPPADGMTPNTSSASAAESEEGVAAPRLVGPASTVPEVPVSTDSAVGTARGSALAPVEPIESRVSTSAGPLSAPGLELEAAQRLLAGADEMGAWLAARGVDLPAPRRELAAALTHAIAGRSEEGRAALDRAAVEGGISPTEQRAALSLLARPITLEQVPVDSVLARAAAMKGLELRALELVDERRGAEAVACISRALLAELDGVWPADPLRLERWSALLASAQREHRWSRRGSWNAHDITVKPGDSLISVRKRAIAERPGLVVCTGQIARANELSGEVIHPGSRLRVPVDEVKMFVDLSAHWALYLCGGEVVGSWPVGVGRDGSETQLGHFIVGEKLKNPMWFPQGRAPVPFGDPANPLGTRWVKWLTPDGRETGLGFHGTNEPESIGRDASQGCIRMRQGDVEELFEILPVGAKIEVVP